MRKKDGAQDAAARYRTIVVVPRRGKGTCLREERRNFRVRLSPPSISSACGRKKK